MTRRRVAIALAITLMPACTGSPHRAGSPTPATRPTPTLGRLRSIVLRADYAQRAARWRLVASIPYGPGPRRLGFIPEGPKSPQPMVPFAFGVGSDGSLWVLDEVKRRVAHYSASGRYLNDIGGLHFDRFHAHPKDLVVLRDRPVVLELGLDLAGIIDVPSSDGGFERTRLLAGSRPVLVDELVQTTGPLVGYVSGRPLRPSAPPISLPRGIFRFDAPGSGVIHRIPGTPLGDGNLIWLHADDPNPFRAVYTTRTMRATRNLTIHVIGAGRRISAVVAPVTQATTQHGVATYVRLAPAKAKAAERFGDGRWFLELSDDNSPLAWERLPTPTFNDETQVRHITAGPDGAIYLMQVRGNGVSIYRR